MSANTLQLLDLWDLTPPSLPPRSRLFSLSPIGIGTPAVESLTGYVTRLAAAHGVVTRRLVESEILPRLGRSYLLRLTVTGDSSSIWKDGETRALNGLGALARDLARAVGTLTLRDDLQWLTLRPWAEVIPVKGLLRRHRAWCPLCNWPAPTPIAGDLCHYWADGPRLVPAPRADGIWGAARRIRWGAPAR